jgi:hypothetical protein
MLLLIPPPTTLGYNPIRSYQFGATIWLLFRDSPAQKKPARGGASHMRLETSRAPRGASAHRYRGLPASSTAARGGPVRQGRCSSRKLPHTSRPRFPGAPAAIGSADQREDQGCDGGSSSQGSEPRRHGHSHLLKIVNGESSSALKGTMTSASAFLLAQLLLQNVNLGDVQGSPEIPNFDSFAPHDSGVSLRWLASSRASSVANDIAARRRRP